MLSERGDGYALEAPVEAKLFDTLHLEKNMHSVIGDIRDREKLIRTMQEAQPEIVFHLAAQPIVRESYKDPVGTMSVSQGKHVGYVAQLWKVVTVDGVEEKPSKY